MDALCEDLIAKFLGPRYAGRRYLRYSEIEALGVVGNRATLKLWMDAGAFPRGIRIAGPYGRTLVWSVPEVVQVLAARAGEREGCEGSIPLSDDDWSENKLSPAGHDTTPGSKEQDRNQCPSTATGGTHVSYSEDPRHASQVR